MDRRARVLAEFAHVRVLVEEVDLGYAFRATARFQARHPGHFGGQILGMILDRRLAERRINRWRTRQF